MLPLFESLAPVTLFSQSLAGKLEILKSVFRRRGWRLPDGNPARSLFERRVGTKCFDLVYSNTVTNSEILKLIARLNPPRNLSCPRAWMGDNPLWVRSIQHHQRFNRPVCGGFKSRSRKSCSKPQHTNRCDRYQLWVHPDQPIWQNQCWTGPDWNLWRIWYTQKFGNNLRFGYDRLAQGSGPVHPARDSRSKFDGRGSGLFFLDRWARKRAWISKFDLWYRKVGICAEN